MSCYRYVTGAPVSRGAGRGVIVAAVLAGGAVVLTTATVRADVIFNETFEGYTNFDGFTNAGLPLVSEGASETWYGGRFGGADGGSINSELAVLRLPDVYPDNVTFGQFEDDAGLLFRISTIGVNNPILSFDWKTHQTESGDRLVAGYYVGAIDFVNDTADGANDSRVHRFNQDGPTWSGGGWVELLRDRNNSTWTKSEFALPGNQADVWVAFWFDNGEGDFGKIDNIVVTPAPSAILLPGLAAAGVIGSRRRRA